MAGGSGRGGVSIQRQGGPVGLPVGGSSKRWSVGTIVIVQTRAINQVSLIPVCPEAVVASSQFRKEPGWYFIRAPTGFLVSFRSAQREAVRKPPRDETNDGAPLRVTESFATQGRAAVDHT